MNSEHIRDLTLRLSQALDPNYNVVNMGAVMSVISALEGTTITKEQLETTRLARNINQLRRRTKSEHLARRAKSLLKKWREMVGIQQIHEQPSSNAAIMINENSIAQTLHHQPQQLQLQQHNHCSQPTSPIIDMNLDNVNQNTNINHADFLRLTVSNPAPTVSSLTRSANLSIYNSNKRLENIEGQSEVASAASSSTVPTSGCRKQPTSFANLITSFGSSGNSISNTKNIANTTAGLRVTSPRVIRKSNKIPERGIKHTETFIIDQSSNSNSEFSCAPSNKLTCVAPIVIDIQDSNSGSNLITSIITNKFKTETPALFTKVAPPSVNSTAVMPLKSKRGKKEKRHKEPESLPYSSTSLLVGDESSSIQHRQTNIEDGKLVPAVEDKSRLKFPYNISEILSLSNSSMSSLFPTAAGGTSKAITEKTPKVELNTTNLLTSDLTFAGKFKHHSSNVPSILSQNNTIGFSGSDRSRLGSSNIPILGPPYPEKNVLNKFIPFSSSACNSNDSTSNSRTSQYDVIDAMSQEKESNAGNVYVQPKSTAENLTPLGISTSQQIAEMTGTNRNVIDKKIPKKRGRKKGSKGVDSVIAKETSLSSQMLISSLGCGGKKVKTTKELYAEMQNRKLGISTNTSSPTLANWASHQQLSSRPESSCSDYLEPSIHSPRTLDACSTNATMSTVATRSTPEKYLINTYVDEVDSDSETTITSEPSRDSNSVQNRLEKGASVDSNSNSQFPASKINECKKTLTQATGNIENQLREILKQLPSVPNIVNIEEECAREIVPCTCQIKEILPDVPETQTEDYNSWQNIPSTYYKIKIAAAEQQHPVVSVNVIEHGADKSKVTTPKPLPGKPKKSIFDLDFDDDEDPLHTLMAEAAAASAKLEMSSVQHDISELEKDLVDTKSDLVTNSEVPPVTAFVHQNISLEQMPSPQPIPIFLTYQVEEDANCLAKQQFEIQTQKITKFHIDALHNCFIPNVNGNWDNADVPSNRLLDYTTDIAADIGNGYNVVPKYGSLINERIRKDLSNVGFTKNFERKKQSLAMEKMYSVPFLGVARRYQFQRKHRKHKHKSCDKSSSIVNVKNEKTVENSEECKLHINSPTKIVHACEDNSKDINDKLITHTNIMCASLYNVTKLNPFNTMTTNNMLLNDITVDVPDLKVVDIHADDGRNFLAIANSSSTEIPQSDELSSKIINADLSPLHKNGTKDRNSTKLLTNIPDSNTVASFSKIIDENASSRRSSSCSNSSLKQTQQSINLKLRRQRLLNQQQEQNFSDRANGRKRKHKKNSRKNYAAESDIELQESKKSRIVRRIKIAINGDVTTQRQILFGSSNNSTDTEDGETASNGSDTSQFADDDFNITINDGEQINKVGDDNDEQDTEEYEDADFYEDDEENYSCDYHEVVTRDLSATSTGNNHIVLTIKKTPSKTIFPYNSLSAISPVITSTINTTSNTLLAVSKTVTQIFSEATGINKVAEKCGQGKLTSCVETINTPAVDKNYENENQVPSCVNLSLACAIDDVSNNMLPSLESKQKQCKRVKAKKSKTYLCHYNNDPEESTTAAVKKEKLHKTLFFPYELSADMLNISSCSSSCTERENSHVSSSNDEITKNNYGESFSGILESLSNTKYKKRNVSQSDCSSCDFPNTPHRCAVPYFTNVSNNSKTKDNECKANFVFKNFERNTFELESMKTDIKGDLSDKNKCDLNVGTVNEEVKIKPSDEFEQSTDHDQLPLENNGLLLSFNNIYYCIDKEEKLSSTYGSIEKFSKVVTMADNDGGTIYDANVIDQPTEEYDEKQKKKQLQKKNCDDFNFYNNNNTFNLIKYDSNAPSLKNIDSFSNSCNHNSGINSYGANYVDYKKLTITNINATVKYNTNLPRIDNYDDYKNSTPSTSCSATIKSESALPASQPPPSSSSPLLTTPQQQFLPHKEYQTGLRAVDEDVDDDDGNNCAHIQQFKEWHQVLQLRSYNDEMLTVLPYVVLE